MYPWSGWWRRLVAVPATRWLDRQTGWSWFDFTSEGARGILSASASSMLTFVVFAVSALLLAVQLASSQLTPRIITFIFSLRSVKVSVGVFVFAYTFTLGALGSHRSAARASIVRFSRGTQRPDKHRPVFLVCPGKYWRICSRLLFCDICGSKDNSSLIASTRARWSG